VSARRGCCRRCSSATASGSADARSAIAPTLARTPLQVRCREPRGADAPRSWHVRSCIAKVALPCRCGSASHGGLTPPAPVHLAVSVCRSLRNRNCKGATSIAERDCCRCTGERPCKCVTVNHGGLTPPAPDACAFVHRKEQDLLAWCATSEYALGARPSRIRCCSRSGCLQLASGLLREVAVTSVAVQPWSRAFVTWTRQQSSANLEASGASMAEASLTDGESLRLRNCTTGT
jgi:hypothetical protein